MLKSPHYTHTNSQYILKSMWVTVRTYGLPSHTNRGMSYTLMKQYSSQPSSLSVLWI